MASSWFAFFGRDFLAATIGWTAEERGHYITLLIAQWEQGGLPADPKRLELVSPGISGCWDTLKEKFPVGVGGRRRNTRLEHERHLAHERSERARQSASRRWAKDSPSCPDDADECERNANALPTHMPSHCSGICSSDAAMTMSYSPPPPPSPPGSLDEETAAGWDRLRDAWNAAWGEKRQWRSLEPPQAAIDRLREPGWLEDALRAIPEIKRGLCAGFDSPPTLRQFCKRDEKGSFVARMLGGEFVDKKRGARPGVMA